MARIRVLVVEDSVTVRAHLIAVLSSVPEIEVVGAAEDGARAIALCQSLRPDVMTLDMIMPVLDGVAVTEHVMAHCPTPILIVSSSTNRGELFSTYQALSAGAVDVLDKPRGDELDDSWARNLIDTIKLVARIKVITHLRGKLTQRAPRPGSPTPRTDAAATRLIAIGASTGGPSAVTQILRALDPGFLLPILLIVHIGETFAAAFAEWLDGQSALRVRQIVDGEPLPLPGEGLVLMAPPDRHIVVQRGRLRAAAEPPMHSCRPSIDVLFHSLAREVGAGVAACLLTGMGRDGADGLRALRLAGARTVAQDEETSVIFGMPREAIAIDAAVDILPLGEIAPVLNSLAARGSAS